MKKLGTHAKQLLIYSLIYCIFGAETSQNRAELCLDTVGTAIRGLNLSEVSLSA